MSIDTNTKKSEYKSNVNSRTTARKEILKLIIDSSCLVSIKTTEQTLLMLVNTSILEYRNYDKIANILVK